MVPKMCTFKLLNVWKKIHYDNNGHITLNRDYHYLPVKYVPILLQ